MKKPLNILVQICIGCVVALLSFSGYRCDATVPTVLPIVEVTAPVHSETHESGGTTHYGGTLLVSDDYLISLEAWNESLGSLVGQVRVKDRQTLEVLRIISLEPFGDTSGHGFQVSVHRNFLAVCRSAEPSSVASLAIYDLNLAQSEPLFFDTIDFEEGYGVSIQGAADFWLLGNSEFTAALELETGSVVQSWAVRLGEMLTESWMLTTIPTESYGGIDSFWLTNIDLDLPPINLRELAEIAPDHTEFYVFQHDGMLIFDAVYNDGESRSEVISAFDLSAEGVVWQLTNPIGDWYDTPSHEGKLYVHDWLNGIYVHDLTTGARLGTIAPPEGEETGWFGWRLSGHGNSLYISGSEGLYHYDARDSSFIAELDTLGFKLSQALVIEVLGSDHLAFAFNHNDYDGFLFNSYYWNPQILLFDQTTDSFTHQFDLENSIIIGGSNYPDASKFGLRFFSVAEGGVGIVSNDLQDSGTQYQVFDPGLRMYEEPTFRLTSLVNYVDQIGYSTTLTKIKEGQAPVLLESIDYGVGGEHSIEVPVGSASSGWSYLLEEQQQFELVDDYQTVIADVNEPLEGVFQDRVTLAPSADAVVVSSWGSLAGDEGTVYVIDAQSHVVRFSVGPFEDRFGSRVAVDGSYMAVGTEAAIAQDSVTVYDLFTGETVLELDGADAFSVNGDVIVRVVGDRLVGHRVSTAEQLYDVPVEYTLTYSWERPELDTGSECCVVEQRVYDLLTGAYRFDLSSPNPEEGDYFGSHIVADGNVIIAVSAPQATAYAFNSITGEHLQTFHLPEFSDGYINYSAPSPLVDYDSQTGAFVWCIYNNPPETQVNIFEFSSGERVAQIRARQPDDAIGGGLFTSSDQLEGGVALHGDELWVRARLGVRLEQGAVHVDVADLLDVVKESRAVELEPQFALRLSWFGRRDHLYQPMAGVSLDGLSAFGEPERGVGGEQSVMLMAPEGSSSWFGNVEFSW